VLTGTGLSWQPCQNEQLPSGALKTGKDVDGESLVIGRAFSKNNLFPGRVQNSQNHICLSCNGQVFEKQEFEVLTVPRENGKSYDIPRFTILEQNFLKKCSTEIVMPFYFPHMKYRKYWFHLQK
jgi:Protein of unknown function (DUF3421)